MQQSVWIEAKALFGELADVPAEVAEAALADREGSKVAVLVRQWLEADRRAGQRGFLKSLELPKAPYVERATDDSLGADDTPVDAQRRVGSKIGPYRLVAFVAQGGMGAVYRAVRDEHYDQDVALKVIRATLDGPSLVARFQRERQAMAKLPHPNIARLLDGGTTDEGLPYLVMEFIEGMRLGAYCRERKLDWRAKATTFHAIVDAIAYAHSRGILHRDLKPSNVLVRADGSPVVTDFGLARTFDGGDLSTQSGAIVGTPSYMAPEQVAGENANGPHVDVYGLGALLYEMLVDRPPFRAATPLETMRQVRGEAPEPPTAIDPKVPKDIETLCLKCLEKEPSKRLASADALLEELDRWLAGRPIVSRPIGPIGRLARWRRRNPAVASALAATFAVLFIGIATAVVLWKAAIRDRALAYEYLRHSLRAVNELFTRMAEDGFAKQPGMANQRREWLEKAIAFYRELPKQAMDDPQYRDELARVHYRVGKVLAELERRVEAIAAFDDSIRLWESLAADFPDNPQFRFELFHANALSANSCDDDVDRLRRAELALAIVADLSDRYPDNPIYGDGVANQAIALGNLCSPCGQDEQAAASYRKGIDIALGLDAKHPDNKTYLKNAGLGALRLAQLHWRHNRPAEAAPLYEMAHEALGGIVAFYPDRPEFVAEWVDVKAHWARFLASRRQFEAAEKLMLEVVRSNERHRSENRDIPNGVLRNVEFLRLLADMYFLCGKPEKSDPLYAACIDDIEKGMIRMPAAMSLPGALADLLDNCPSAKHRDLRLSWAIYQRLVANEEGRKNVDGGRGLEWACRTARCREAIDDIERRLQARPNDATVRPRLLCKLTIAQKAAGQNEAASATYKAATEAFCELQAPPVELVLLFREAGGR